MTSNTKTAIRISAEDKDFLYQHLRAYINHSVPDELHDAFEVYAITEVESDPEHWFHGCWTNLYNSFLATEVN